MEPVMLWTHIKHFALALTHVRARIARTRKIPTNRGPRQSDNLFYCSFVNKNTVRRSLARIRWRVSATRSPSHTRYYSVFNISLFLVILHATFSHWPYTDVRLDRDPRDVTFGRLTVNARTRLLMLCILMNFICFSRHSNCNRQSRSLGVLDACGATKRFISFLILHLWVWSDSLKY